MHVATRQADGAALTPRPTAPLCTRVAAMPEAKPFHLFVVEDDPALRDMLSAYLEKNDLIVTTMTSAEDLLVRMHRIRPDLVVLDVGLPGMSGLEACRRLRAEGDRVPIVLLTAHADEVDRVLGLEMGADDYIGKPFSARELLARVRAVLRRVSSTPGLPALRAAPVALGETVFSPATRSLQRGDDIKVLNTVEFALLAELVANPRVPVSRERLLSASHSRTDAVLLRTIDTAIMRLRRLIEPDPAEPRFIQTVRGHGYMFVPGG
jgi:two-component system, OmpR family, phosphate regulon response regulator OmpR